MGCDVLVKSVVFAGAGVLAWTGLSVPAQASTASDIEAAMLKIAEVSTQYARDAGGYRAERTAQYGDGGKLNWVAKYEANGSLEFHKVYEPPADSPNAATHETHYIWDADVKAFAYPRPDSDDYRRAYKIIGAPASAWLVRKMSSFNGTTMKSRNGGAGANILAFLRENTVISGSVELPSRVRANVEGSDGLRSTIVLTLGAAGQLIEVQVTDDSGFSLTEKVTYDNYDSSLPDRSGLVTYANFERALQSEYLSDRVYGLAVETKINITRATPATLYTEAKRQVAEAYRSGWRIKVKVRKVAMGVRLQAKHPFAKQTFVYDVVARPPYPSSSVEIRARLPMS